MTNLELLYVMSDVDSDLLSRAEAPVPLRRKPIFRIALIAAVIALVLSLGMTVLGVGYVTATVKRVEQTYPEYDGTVLHFVQIVLTEDDNVISNLLSEETKNALGGAIAALRESWNGSSEESDVDSEPETRDPDHGTDDETQTEDTTKDEQTTEPEQTTTKPAEDEAIFVHSSYDRLSMVAGDNEIDVFTLDTYGQWRKRVEVTDPAVTHLKFRGWLSFVHDTPGTYGYRIDEGEIVYDEAFSQEPEDMVHAVSAYMGGKSCSRMEILIPIDHLAPGEHKVYICVKAVNGRESNLVIFTLVIPDDGGQTETAPDGTDVPPEGYSVGLQYTEIQVDGEKVYAVSGMGECTDTVLHIPPEYQGCPVVAIAEGAFAAESIFDSKITAVILPETVTVIEENAFYNCTQLVSVTLPYGLREIGKSAFADCSRLKSVTLPSSLEIIGETAFDACRALTQITIPASVHTLGRNVFRSSGLAEVTLQGEIENLGRSPFQHCSMLEKVTLPDTMTRIPAWIFEFTGLKDFTVPDGIVEIGDGAFWASDLESITIPESVTRIGEDAFNQCLELREIVLPSGITSIERGTFDRCSSLTNVTIPAGVTFIGWGAFTDCESLKSISIPDGVTEISAYAFAGCTSMTEAVIGKGTVKIDESAFYLCSKLKKITLPSSLTTVGKGAFEDCTRLASVYFGGTQEQWSAIEIDEDNTELTSAKLYCDQVN